MSKPLNVTLLVGGSIAAYKSAELVRQLSKRDTSVQVVMSRAATEFIAPLTLQTLSGNPVRVDSFDLASEARVSHIDLADNADVILVAPASADIIARAAHGLADDLLTTVLLAATSPVVIAPAMNVNMWNHPATQANVATLRSRGVLVLEPGDGFLACGWTGSGRLPELEAILQALDTASTPDNYSDCRVIVTAGPTREFLDPIRFISNRSSGKMGYAIARAAVCRGASVTLISGPSDETAPAGVELVQVTTALEMHREVSERVRAQSSDEALARQYVFMVAAVSDHRPKVESPSKVKHDKEASYSIDMVPSPDILRELGDSREAIEKESGVQLRLVGFAAETGDQEELLHWARQKLQVKNSDLIVGNFAHDSFEKDTNRVWLLDRTGRQEEIATSRKTQIAGKIMDRARKL